MVIILFERRNFFCFTEFCFIPQSGREDAPELSEFEYQGIIGEPNNKTTTRTTSTAAIKDSHYPTDITRGEQNLASRLQEKFGSHSEILLQQNNILTEEIKVRKIPFLWGQGV